MLLHLFTSLIDLHVLCPAVTLGALRGFLKVSLDFHHEATVWVRRVQFLSSLLMWGIKED